MKTLIRITSLSILLSASGCSNNFNHDTNRHSETKDSIQFKNSTQNIGEEVEKEELKETNTCDENQIIGKWRSDEDKKSSLLITNGYLIHQYDNLNIDSMKFDLRNTIDSEKRNKSETCYLVAQDRVNDLTFEYEIVSVSEKGLTLMNMDRGNLLIYTRE